MSPFASEQLLELREAGATVEVLDEHEDGSLLVLIRKPDAPRSQTVLTIGIEPCGHGMASIAVH